MGTTLKTAKCGKKRDGERRRNHPWLHSILAVRNGDPFAESLWPAMPVPRAGPLDRRKPHCLAAPEETPLPHLQCAPYGSPVSARSSTQILPGSGVRSGPSRREVFKNKFLPPACRTNIRSLGWKQAWVFRSALRSHRGANASPFPIRAIQTGRVERKESRATAALVCRQLDRHSTEATDHADVDRKSEGVNTASRHYHSRRS